MLPGKPLQAAETLKIYRISPEGGFTFDAITAISEDKFGFIWFGSSNGLYRYNSAETSKFINSPGDPSSIAGNMVRSLFTDLRQELWIATNGGFCRYDYNSEHFVRYSFHDPAGKPLGINAQQMIQTPDSNYWMVDVNGFAGVNLRTSVATYLPMPAAAENDVVRFVVLNRQDSRIWLGGKNGGIYFSDPPYREIDFFARARTESVFSILPDGDQLWVGYDWGGADNFTRQGNLIAHYGDKEIDRYRIPSDRVRTIFRNRDEIWIGTFKGLVRIRPSGTDVVDKERYSGLLSNSIFQLYRDSRNGIWIGTWSGGLSYINEWSNNFEHFSRESIVNSLSDNVVSDFEETSDGSVIAATEEGQLNYLNLTDKNFRLQRIQTKNGTVNHIKSLYTDSRGTLWIGTYATGIFYREAGSAEYRHFDLIPDRKEQFFDITSTRDGVWFASDIGGLYFYNYTTREVKQYQQRSADSESLSNRNVRTLLADSRGNLWVGTSNGLNMKVRDTDKFRRFFFHAGNKNSLSNNYIYSLMEDSRHNIWIGTAGGGVNIYDPLTASFSSLTKKDGMPGNDVYGILEDDNGTIWMSTENGIAAWTPDRKMFRNYEYVDGLQGNQFNPGSAFKSRSGELYFGGSNGFTRFDPKQMKENPVIPKAYITRLEINNQEIHVAREEGILTQSLLTLRHLKLKYNQNSLRFDFVANNFLLPEKNRFRYRLSGYSQDWIEIQKDNKAIFTKIPPGEYTFEVMASNNDGKWSTEPTRLKISVSSPFWLSGYAILLYLLTLSVVVYALQRELKLRHQLRNSILQERIQREQEEKLHQLKLRFFTNISHEFRTPLTLILSPLSQLKNRFHGNEEHLEHFRLIENNANRLLRLVNQILDIRKIEMGKMSYQPQPFDLVALCREVFQCFSSQENDRKIRFVFESDYSSLFMMIEPDKIDKLIYNLLSNAMKFTRHDGMILLGVRKTGWQPGEMAEPFSHLVGDPLRGDYVTIVVKNEGQGISKDDLENIFERFYQAPGQITGTGIGLHLCAEYALMHHGQIEVFSGEGMGATFMVRLPVTAEESGKGNLDPVVQDTGQDHPDGQATGLGDPHRSVLGNRVLVVEDNREMQQFLKRLLSEFYVVATADDGTGGLKVVRDFGPDLVVTDVMMPGMDGNEFCHQLKSDLNTSHIPVLMLTALSSVENQLEGYKLGADDYVVKPFDERILVQRIRLLLESRANLREKFAGAMEEWKEEMQNYQPEKEVIEKATLIIEDHLTDPLFTVDMLASELGLSRSSLHRKLRMLTNQSATEFIKFVRINKSIRLIESGETNIDEICFRVGFNSHSYYTMCFRKQMGMTPSEYIARLKRESRK